MLKYTCFSGAKVFKILGFPGNIFSVGEREHKENLFSALVPGAACESHIKLISTLGDQALLAGSSKMQSLLPWGRLRWPRGLGYLHTAIPHPILHSRPLPREKPDESSTL